MTESAVPPTAPGPPGLAVPPAAPSVGRPSIWQAVLLFLAFGGLAGGLCAAFLSGNISHPSATTELWSLVFVGSMPLAAGAFTLLVFRLVRRRAGEAWPSVLQSVLILAAGGVLAAGGCGGWALTLESLMPVAMVMFAAFVVGLTLLTGGVELFVVAIGRLIFKRPGAR